MKKATTTRATSLHALLRKAEWDLNDAKLELSGAEKARAELANKVAEIESRIEAMETAARNEIGANEKLNVDTMQLYARSLEGLENELRAGERQRAMADARIEKAMNKVMERRQEFRLYENLVERYDAAERMKKWKRSVKQLEEVNLQRYWRGYGH